MNKLIEIVLDEQKFPYENMSLEERNYCLNIIKNCKDVKDSEHKIDGECECQILELRFKRTDNRVSINGSLSIGTDNVREYRCIDGFIFTQHDSVIVDYHITRLCEEKGCAEYTVLDEFKLVGNRLVRNSSYNYDMKITKTEIDDETLKGRLK